MMRLPAPVVLAGLAALVVLAPVRPAAAADPLREPAPFGVLQPGFRATCEDLGRFCFADACGRDQIEAAEGCRARCPSAVVMSVVPAACPSAVPGVVLERRG